MSHPHGPSLSPRWCLSLQQDNSTDAAGASTRCAVTLGRWPRAARGACSRNGTARAGRPVWPTLKPQGGTALTLAAVYCSFSTAIRKMTRVALCLVFDLPVAGWVTGTACPQRPCPCAASSSRCLTPFLLVPYFFFTLKLLLDFLFPCCCVTPTILTFSAFFPALCLSLKLVMAMAMCTDYLLHACQGGFIFLLVGWNPPLVFIFCMKSKTLSRWAQTFSLPCALLSSTHLISLSSVQLLSRMPRGCRGNWTSFQPATEVKGYHTHPSEEQVVPATGCNGSRIGPSRVCLPLRKA